MKLSIALIVTVIAEESEVGRNVFQEINVIPKINKKDNFFIIS